MPMPILHFLFMFSYVSGSSSFPQPLTAEEEARYLQEYEMGSEEAKAVLIERNLRLVAHIAKKYAGYNKENEDLISAGTIGLIKGITSFDTGKGTRLATYLSRCIENEILMSIRASKKYQNEVHLQDPIGKDKEGNEIRIVETIGADRESVVDQVELGLEVKKLYEKMQSVLKDRERLVLELRYGLYTGEEVTQREIAEMLGISRSYISRIEKKALKKLRAEMSK